MQETKIRTPKINRCLWSLRELVCSLFSAFVSGMIFRASRAKFWTFGRKKYTNGSQLMWTWLQDDVITRSLAMFDCALWSPAKDEPPAAVTATPPTPLSTTTFSQSLSPSPPPPSYSLLPPIPPPLPSQPPPGYTVQDQELYLLLAAHWWNQPEAPLFCWS